jgi:divalent metal cation (Fe/Co/Zn/Cd) transporter
MRTEKDTKQFQIRVCTYNNDYMYLKNVHEVQQQIEKLIKTKHKITFFFLIMNSKNERQTNKKKKQWRN